MRCGRVPTFDEQNLTDSEVILRQAEDAQRTAEYTVDDLQEELRKARIAVETAKRKREFARQHHDRLERGRDEHERRRPK